MATKKTASQYGNTTRDSIPHISAKIDRMINLDNSKVKAIASVNIGGAFAIHGLKVIDSQHGLFVQMPQSSFEKDGKKHYSDQFHPVTADARNGLIYAVMAAYEQKLVDAENATQSCGTAEGFAPKM